MDLAPATLEHKRVRLEPFEERHRDDLVKAAADPAIWRHIPFPVVQRGYSAWFDDLRRDQAAGVFFPFAVHADGQVVGQSCYLNFRPRDSSVEIGATWYAPQAQGTFVNPTAKLLLLGHAFASGAERVELKTDALNTRSRAAMLKLGCTYEGIHRRHMRRPDGTWRDTAWYSIIFEEWPVIRERIEARIATFE